MFSTFLSDAGFVISRTIVVTTRTRPRKCARANTANVPNPNSNAETENAFPEDGVAIWMTIVEMEVTKM